jgi:hypothetical protein
LKATANRAPENKADCAQPNLAAKAAPLFCELGL